MTTHDRARRTPGHHARRRAAIGLLAAVVACAGAAGPRQAAPAQAADVADTYRARYHFTVPDHWKNDPQRPVVIDGTTHYYYLYNADYDDAVGTAWRLATTTDNVVFHDQGVAAPKATNANYDLWSGSAVVDTAGTAGFGAGAVIMLVTQMDHPTPAQILDASGPQAQFLWYSTDGGRNFRPHGEAPVIPNGGRRDFRDPKIVWDADRGRWVALIAEGQRIGFWTSPNLKDWTRVSEYVNTGLGILECPDLFQIRADDGALRWVMGLSGNGYLTDSPSTYAYWTGSFDGTSFVPDQADPQWLDHGFDWYGAVTWPDPASAQLDRRFAVGWMNSWSYPYTTPTWAADGFNGTDSIVREIRLARTGSGYALLSQPVAALDSLATSVTELGTVHVDGHVPLDYQGDAYQVETDISWTDLENVGLQLRRSADGRRHADVGVFGDVTYLNRGGTGNPDPSGEKWESHAPFDPAADRVHLRILVDRTTIEVFVDDGRYVHSSQVFAEPADTGIALYSAGGAATFSNLTITALDAPDQRPARVLAGFEGSDWGSGWTATGSFVDAGPTTGSLPGQVGRQVLDTFVGGGDPATGTITSPPFTIDRRYLHLLLGGGDHPLGVEPATSVNLLVDGRPVRTATGRDEGTLRPVRWDLGDLAGRQAQVQVLDDATGGWGHLMVDQIVLSD
ncbi:GH32 C-terminal domain-containing protein [Cellulomonas sp. Root137]|uniref:glycoside hydrolase family 32 protein n=1 Tax=Cellulomonas sp. Root137 TaxID=1736459 RepID=UPI0009E6FF47|nr:GH32 C-terminal domain-containing protein [Cellulomonas sp. Root137]